MRRFLVVVMGLGLFASPLWAGPTTSEIFREFLFQALEGKVADKITLSFDKGPEIPNDIGAWTKVVLSNINLDVYSHDQTTTDQWIYQVPGDQAYMWFKKTGNVWRIVQWKDMPIGHKDAQVQREDRAVRRNDLRGRLRCRGRRRRPPALRRTRTQRLRHHARRGGFVGAHRPEGGDGQPRPIPAGVRSAAAGR